MASRYPHSRRWPWAALWCLGSACAGEPRWQFEPGLLHGTGINAETVRRFNRADALLPGIHHVELNVNGQFIARTDIRFAENAHGEVRPCLERDAWLRGGVDPDSIQDVDGDCPELSAQVPGSSSELERARMRLAVSVPQSLMQRAPRTAVAVDELDAGSSVVFFNYMGNLWHAERSGAQWGKHQDTGFLSLSGGANFGRWQYRQHGHLSIGSQQPSHWHNLNSHLRRPLPGVAGGSQLSIGQLHTNGRFFSGLAYEGLALASDPRVLTDQQRGYAPVVRGSAKTNAKISIRQKGQEIYQTTVAPGAFVIDDLAPTSYNGDLEVVVEEADGTVNRFSVPFSALPESLRPGHTRYALALGRTRSSRENSGFADASLQRGVSNRVSLGAGVRVALGYQAIATEAVYLGRAGALGVSVNHSRASVPGRGAQSGWMAGLSYSHTFAPTDTHLAIAAYRYSTAGYRDLGDVLGERASNHDDAAKPASSLQQRARLEVSISQALGEYGHLFLSGSMQNWHHSHRRDQQWQIGYGTSWANGISLNLSLTRQSTTFTPGADGMPQHDTRDTALGLSLSMPLGAGSAATLGSGYSHSGGGSQFTTDVSGSADGTSYNLGASHSGAQHHTVWHGSVQQRLANASVGLNASRGPQHWQVAANVQGALALHQGGVTFGPYLGETFALVEAKGAHGARVGGSGQARIDRRGYALLPALSPYRINRVFLDPQGAAGNLEVEHGEVRVAPYPGAAVKLNFHTRSGQALLIHVNTPDGRALPPGTEALDEGGNSIGMLGQGNWLYLRSESGRGQVQLRWGENPHERCQLTYDTDDQPQASLVRLQAHCTRNA